MSLRARTEDEQEKEPMNEDDQHPDCDQKVVMERQLGLLDGVAMIVGTIVGSGIFISPKGVLLSAGSSGLSIIIWTLCGFVSFVGAICYAELGTMIDRSGGNYAYLSEAYGPLPSFMFLWASLLIFIPVTNAINALAFANYLLLPLWGTCLPSESAVRLVAAFAIASLCLINCWNVNWSAKLRSVFLIAKVVALALVIVTGCAFYFVQGNSTRGFQEPFATTSTDPSLIALSFYSGLFSYGGWNCLNFVVEELKDPYKNLPRAIGISMPIITLVYALANVAYLIVLTPEELLSSSAVAVTFGERVYGSLTWIVQILVAMSALGSLHCNIFSSSRIFFVGARNGHLPGALALISLENLTPKPAIMFIGALAIAMLIVGDVYVLINYVMFTDSAFLLATVTGLLWLRWKRPNAVRPIKVNLAYPIAFLLVSVFLVCLPIISNPVGAVTAIAITASAIPVFCLCIAWKRKPNWISSSNQRLTTMCQKVFLAVPEVANDKQY
ncbi:large neutral amino acids transporter small subunit 2 [Daphnia magna]|uniref:large neutral amino acids transporter small subunit 2 n=1 Tax=Daphnia magna TaxID=35525 RepID=UPI001E1BA5C3|nr:large neutral amino acids transporter small subunit 2 [Daphnia magna]